MRKVGFHRLGRYGEIVENSVVDEPPKGKLFSTLNFMYSVGIEDVEGGCRKPPPLWKLCKFISLSPIFFLLQNCVYISVHLIHACRYSVYLVFKLSSRVLILYVQILGHLLVPGKCYSIKLTLQRFN